MTAALGNLEVSFRFRSLARHFVMPMHSCMGINELKLLHELAKCLLLLWRACVLGRFSVLGHTTDVADANAVGIMPQAMGASYVLGTSLVDAAVTIDDIMITDVGKLACQVPTTNVLHREVLAFGSCRTVNDQFIYLSHSVVRFAIGYSSWLPRP